MARLWSSGFELNGFLDWSAGNLTVQTSTVRSGTYAAESVLVSGSARGVRHIFQSAPSNGPYYYRVYLRVATRPSAENRIIALTNADSLTASHIAWLTHDNSGVLKLYDEDGQITGTTTLSTGVWYRLEMQVDRTAAAGSQVVRALVDGTEFAGSATRSLSAGIWVCVVGANLANEAQTVGSWFFDDVALNNSTGSFQNTYPGEGEIIHLRPNATGDNSDWTNDYTTIDEVTPNDATDFISSNTNNQIEDVNLDTTPAAMASSDVINVVQVGVRFNISDATGADPTACLRIKASASGTVEESANLNNNTTTWTTNSNTTPKNYVLTLYDLPGASTTAWTKADLDQAQIGVRETTTDTHLVQVSTLWLLVDHKPGQTIIDLTADINGVTTTPSATVNVARSLIGAVDGVTTTPSAAVTVVRPLTASVDGVTVTSSASLRITRALLASSDWQSVTSSATINVVRALLASVDGQTVTSSAAITILRALSAVSAWQSLSSAANITVGTLRELVALLEFQTVTSSGSLRVTRNLVGDTNWQSTTSSATVNIIRSLLASSDWQSITSSASMTMLRRLLASSDWATSTSNPTLAVQRLFIALSTWQSLTSEANLATGLVFEALISMATSTSIPSINITRRLVTSSDWQSQTSSSAMTINHQLQALSTWQSQTNNATMTLVILFTAMSTWQTVTSEADLITVFAEGLVRAIFGAKQPSESFSEKQPDLAFSSKTPSIVFLE